ncbi:MAG: hypothetical protein IPO15_14775 [Anaerolineae bacterium]|uniref:hypothetical protein n=1 Tax=Candidatus Amarolinea dominans TaxID=3140696 RepID=UPI00313663C8|nr:hypothetical protein [Anaerolineae bacterium]
MAESSAISRIQSGSRTANKQLKFIFGGVLIAAVILYLIISVIGEGAYYKEVGGPGAASRR